MQFAIAQGSAVMIKDVVVLKLIKTSHSHNKGKAAKTIVNFLFFIVMGVQSS
jgi:hypothetical protein